jgi:hypothetical protein
MKGNYFILEQIYFQSELNYISEVEIFRLKNDCSI